MSNKQSEKTKTSGGEAELLDHDYDGIQELDNMLPRWWVYLFYACIAFAVFYYAYYELGGGQSIDQEFNADIGALQDKAREKSQVPFPNEQKLLAVQNHGSSIGKGKEVFQSKCASCHGEHGQGLIGPNLTDEFWLHRDGKVLSLAQTIHAGIPDKGMPPWGPVLSEEDIYRVAVFVHSLKGSNPAAAKAPQGKHE